MLDFHKNYYSNNGKISKGKKYNPLTPEGHLTTAEKKKILLNNIYGVDLDVNAVEVTKLSLLLKCLEGETSASISHQLSMFHERVLPTLENNIKDGNSLIGTDFYSSELDFGFEKKIKPFSWENAFPEIFDQGGFNVVIGNPPYVLIEGEFRNDEMLTYFKKNFKSASFKIDLYHLFFERGLQILKNNGSLGLITPSNYISNNGLLGLREIILEKSNIVTINNISGKVFSGASVDTSISILSKTNSKKPSTFIHSTWNGSSLDEITIKEFDQNNFKENEGKIFISTEKKTKFKRKTYDLEDKYFVKFGMQLRDRKIYKADVINEEEKSLITKYHRPCYTGKDVNKWEMSYSNLLAYFNREARSGGCWNETFHNANPKIIVRQIGLIPSCALDERGYCCLNTVFMIVPRTDSEINLKYILGILNSSLIANYWKQNFSDLRQTFPNIKGSYLGKLPIALIDLKDNDEKKQHDEIVKLVDQLLTLKKEIKKTKLQTKISQFESKIDYCENRINELVYQLYGLTAEEIKIVENG